jgi:hypothetical protein
MSADFLYWQANQSGMSYGRIVNSFADIQAPPLSSGQNFSGSELGLCFKSNPGVRLALGFQPQEDFWRVDLIWTHLNTNAAGASHNPDVLGGSTVVPSFDVPDVLGNSGINASACWLAHYNTLDLDIHNDVFQSDAVCLQAHMGLRNLWLHQKYNIFSFRAFDSITPPILFIDSTGNMVENIWGIGPMLGIGSQWNICGGFNLFGQASFALIWSHICSTNVGTILANVPTVTGNRVASFYTTLPEASLIVGAQYSWAFDDAYEGSIRLGWELQTLFDANFLGGIHQPAGNFNLGGLTAGLSFEF